MNPPSLLIAAWALLLACQGPSRGAEPAAPVNEVGAAAFEVQHVTGDVQLRLQGASRDAKRGDWPSALEMLIACIDEMGDDLYRVAPDRFVPVRTFLQGRIASLPAPALESYRSLVDQQAGDWFAKGVADADRRPLEMVVRTAFCSSWGDDALIALGDMAASRGWYASARHCWRRVHVGVDAVIDAKDAPGRLSRCAPYLLFPDTVRQPAALQARLILADVMADDWASATNRFRLFRQRYSRVDGTIAGRRGPLVEILGQVMNDAQKWPPPATPTDWTTFGGAPGRQRVVTPADRVIKSVAWRYAVDRPDGGVRHANDVRATASPETPPERVRRADRRMHPIVLNDLVLVNDSRQIIALAIETGEPAFGGPTARIFSTDSQQAATRQSASALQFGCHDTLSAFDARVYARIGEAGRIVCLDLSRQGKLLWQTSPDHARGTFEGTPVADETAVYVGMTVGDPAYEHYVVCLDACDGYPRWRTRIGRSDGHRRDRQADNLLTLAEGRLYYNTNEGAVAALSPDDGSIDWLWTHSPDTSLAATRGDIPKGPSPAVFADGFLLVAPQNDRRVFALSAATGCLQWTTVIDEPRLEILGTPSSAACVAGNGLWGLDLHTGAVLWKWPDHPAPELFPRARPVLVGDKVLWPAGQGLYAIEGAPRPGAAVPAAKASRLELEDYEPGNILYARGYVIIAGANRIDCAPYAAGENAVPRRGPARVERKPG